MKINIQSIHFTADASLLEFIEKKPHKLEQHFHQIVSIEVYLKLERAETENKITEIRQVFNPYGS